MKLDTFFTKSIFTVGVATLTLGGYFAITSFIANYDEDVKTSPEKSFENDYNVFAIDLPEQIDFAGEKIPLDIPDIKERLDRELLVNTYWQSNALLLIKRAHKYFPIIEPILKKNGSPDDFKYLAVAESGLEHVVSPAGATGFWQIMKGTAQDYGLEVNNNVDERYHIEKATEVASQYLNNSKERFGTWTLAAASYNAGNAGISRELKRQEVDDYFDLLLNPETSRYVFRIVALKHILSNAEDFGFHYEDKDLYEMKPIKKVEVDTAVSDFVNFAKQFNMNYKTLKIHNPWLRDKHLDNYSKKVYKIEVLK
jgi:hypothetical protein